MVAFLPCLATSQRDATFYALDQDRAELFRTVRAVILSRGRSELKVEINSKNEVAKINGHPVQLTAEGVFGLNADYSLKSFDIEEKALRQLFERIAKKEGVGRALSDDPNWPQWRKVVPPNP